MSGLFPGLPRTGRPIAPGALLAAVCLLGGCASLVDVRSLATGRSDVAAYELRGSDIAALRREARRLCPQGGEILRQAGHDIRSAQDDSRLRRWANATGDWLNPPQREAQLMLVCKDDPALAGLAAVGDGAAVDGAAKVAAAAASAPPVGPLNVEW